MRLVLVSALAACGTSIPTTPYLSDRAYRRAELEASLVNPANGYSQLRLASYGLAAGGWDAFPETRLDDLDLDVDPTDDAALIALGAEAFARVPVQPLPAGTVAPGVVQLTRADGSSATAGTCATCHAAGDVRGLANAAFDLGKIFVDGGWIPQADVAAHLAWGPGRVDVTTGAGTEPVRIPDLRPVRDLTFLQADADVRLRDRDTLAIRIETLIITTHDEDTRPPRIVTLALAAYLESLADALPAPAPPDVFVETCAGCHAPPALTGDPVPLDIVGTDPVLGDSAVRGTGSYRVPSLHGVGQRALLLHDGSLGSLAAMFDPARTGAGYTGGVRPGPVPGHTYGLDLSDADRVALLTYLETL